MKLHNPIRARTAMQFWCTGPATERVVPRPSAAGIPHCGRQSNGEHNPPPTGRSTHHASLRAQTAGAESRIYVRSCGYQLRIRSPRGVEHVANVATFDHDAFYSSTVLLYIRVNIEHTNINWLVKWLQIGLHLRMQYIQDDTMQ